MVKDLDLRIGHIEPADLLEIRISEAEAVAARERVLRMMAYHDTSRADLLHRLTRDGYPAELASDIVDSLSESGIVDDSRYAASFAHLLSEVRGYGRSRVRRELLAHGIAPALVEAALEEVTDDDREAQRAAELARSLVARTGRDVHRLASRLSRKGFSTDVALRAARATVEALPAEEEDA